MTLFACDLTLDNIRAEVRRVEAMKDDPEAAHGIEDNLHALTLEAIAIGVFKGVDAQRAALYALDSDRIEFPRWAA